MHGTFIPVIVMSLRNFSHMRKIFQLVVGYPPFDSIMPSKEGLVREWVAMFGDLPEEWHPYLPRSKADTIPIDQVTLADWLHDTYFDEDKKADFAEAHIEELGDLLQSMMQYRPPDRPRISEILAHPWFRKNPWR